MTFVALQIEGDAQTLSAAMETVRKELERIGGGASQEQITAEAASHIAIANHHRALTNGAIQGTAQKAHRESNKNAAASAPMSDTSVGMRILRYLTEAKEAGIPDCTIEEVHPMGGSSTQDGTKSFLFQLKRKGLVQAGTSRGQWQISEQGAAVIAKQRVES
jgi:hypothetical protein